MISLKNVSFKYDSKLPYVLKDINLNIDPKEKILIAGKNGAGKTTFSKILCGILPGIEKGILEGCIYPIDFSKKTGILFQDFESQLITTTVKEELIFYSLNKGISYEQSLSFAKEIIKNFELENLFEREIITLSGGEKQKIALLSLLSANPEIIILDEPFTDLDPVSREEVLFFMKQKFSDKPILFFEQSLNYFEFFDRIILLKDGKIFYDESKEEILNGDIVRSAVLELPGIYKIFSGVDKEKADLFIINNFIFDENKYLEIKNNDLKEKQSIIKIENLNYKYPNSKDYVLKNIDFEIFKGDMVIVAGQNGSGKTTLMKIIAGIIPFKEGKITKNNNIKTGYIYQNPDNQIFAETVFKEISFILEMAKMEEDFIIHKTENVLKIMGLYDKKEEDPFILSKGDRQKIACASILVAEPDFLILDEPTTGLDYISLKSLMSIIDELNQKGKTIFIITHDMEIAAEYGNKILIMSNGEVLYFGEKRKAFESDEILKKAKIKTTDLMDITLSANGKLLLNEKEFFQCWIKK